MTAPRSSDAQPRPPADPAPSLTARRRAAKRDIHAVREFEQLIRKVDQAEDALEASERAVAADWRQLHASWRAGWTPLRIVIAGIASGFALGRLDRGRGAAPGGAGFLQMLSTVSGLIASVNAQMAASEAEHAAGSADDAADAANAAGPARTSTAEPPRE